LRYNNLTYLLMAPVFKPSDWQRINDDFWQKHMKEPASTVKSSWRSWVVPLTGLHMQTEVPDSLRTGNRMYVYGCAAVALFILLVACINYMNLATARATRRARSVGIRKVLGATRFGLAAGFLAEAVLLSMFATFLGVAIVALAIALTPLNSLMEGQVQLSALGDPVLLLWLLGMGVCMGLASGAYPAFYLSSWAPQTALTGKQPAGTRHHRLREALVLVQLTISAAVIAGTLLMAAQMRYVSTMPLGFDREHRLIVTLRGASTIERWQTLRTEMMQDSHIQAVGITGRSPVQAMVSVNLFPVEQEDGRLETTPSNTMPIGEGFAEAMGLKFLQGDDVGIKRMPGEPVNVLVNEAMVRKMGWTTPLGKRVALGQPAGRVIGVVQDFNFTSLHSQIEPLVMNAVRTDYTAADERERLGAQASLVVKISAENTRRSLEVIERVVAQADPKHPVEYMFLDEGLDRLYKTESQLLALIAIFATVCIMIACLGLFGLATFTTEIRTREIGTRKVLGASRWQIIALLSRPVMVLVLVASVLAPVIAWFAIDKWLETFAYRAGINPAIFVITAGVVAVVASATVAAQSYRVASSNPVDSLRHT
jgi:putative ABC transport system permease protein